METVAVFYQVLGQGQGNGGAEQKNNNVYFLTVPQGREVLLLDLLQLWMQGGADRVCYSFFASDGCGGRLALLSPLSLLPVTDQAVHLLLEPAAAPPVTPVDQCGEWLDYSRWQMDKPDLYRESPLPARYRDGENISRSKASAPARRDQPDDSRGRGGDRNEQPPRSRPAEEKFDNIFAPPGRDSASSNAPPPPRRPEGQQREQGQREQSRNSNLFTPGAQDENLAALAGAASVASEYTGIAARSLFNFAAKSIKSVASNVASLTGHIQVGHHKVVLVKEIAQGGFGIVSLVKDVNDGKVFAMKQMFCQSREQVEEAHLELTTLQKFSNDPHIITLVDHASIPASKGQFRQILLLFPFYSAGTAWDMVERALPAPGAEGAAAGGNWPFPERAAVATIMGTARALRTMHDEGVAHRDIKPHNILISDTFDPIIMDLGSVGPTRVEIRNRLEALKAEDEASCKCSAPYRAPELTQVNKECHIDEKIDTWSLGCTAYCLAFGNSPFESAREGVLKLAILNARYNVPEHNMNVCGVTYSSGYIALIQHMLQLDPADRPDMDEVVQECKTLLAAVTNV
jgi:serine/threonine kinase 16